MSDQTIRVVPKNGHVYDPLHKQYLKQVEQDLPRTPLWLNALRIGDLIEVAEQPVVATPEVTPTVAVKKTASKATSKTSS